MNKNIWLALGVMLSLVVFIYPSNAVNSSVPYADGFVFPVTRDEPANSDEFVFNKADPLSYGWTGNGVGVNANSKFKGHLGQDYFLEKGNKAGKRVYAAANGKVEEVMDSNNKYGWCNKRSHGWGRVIVIKHEAPLGAFFNTDGSIVSETYIPKDSRHPGSTEKNPTIVYTLYGHLSKQDLEVKPGDTVKKGQPIARVGSSMEVSEYPADWIPHLHFEIKSQEGFDEGVWDKKNPGKHLTQWCKKTISGIGSGYSFISGYAPERYDPGSFIKNNIEIRSSAEKEAIVFLRDGNLWVMDNDGKNQRQLTYEGVGNFSVSKNGIIAFDRFSPYGSLSRLYNLTDSNIYLVTVIDREIKKLTHDNKSITPEISSNGKVIAFQKFKWLGERNWRGSGEGIWIMDLNNEVPKEYLLADVLPIPNEIKEERNKSWKKLREGQMDEDKWLYDMKFLWSPDSKILIFQRTYEYGGIVNYSVYFREQSPPIIFPEKFLPFIKDLYNHWILYFDNPSFSLRIFDIEEREDRLLSNKVFVSKGKFSPDGKDIVYLTQSGKHATLTNLWIVKNSGENKRKLLSYETVPNIDTENVSWSTDGKKILFERYTSARENEVLVIDTNGLNLKKLAGNAASPHRIFIPELEQKQMIVKEISKKQGDIRKVDFENFSYEISDKWCAKELGTSVVNTHNGTFGDPTDFYFGVYVDGNVYGDLTGDGQDEAVVLTYCGGMHPLEQAFIYTMHEGSPKLLTKLASGDRAIGGINGIKIQNMLLIVERMWGKAACCPEYIEKKAYRWDGNNLVQVGQVEIRQD